MTGQLVLEIDLSLGKRKKKSPPDLLIRHPLDRAICPSSRIPRSFRQREEETGYKYARHPQAGESKEGECARPRTPREEGPLLQLSAEGRVHRRVRPEGGAAGARVGREQGELFGGSHATVLQHAG